MTGLSDVVCELQSSQMSNSLLLLIATARCVTHHSWSLVSLRHVSESAIESASEADTVAGTSIECSGRPEGCARRSISRKSARGW